MERLLHKRTVSIHRKALQAERRQAHDEDKRNLLRYRRERKDLKESSANGESNAGNIEKVEVPAPKDAAPELNPLEWSDFKRLREVSEAESFAIDILLGEPKIDFGLPSYSKAGLRETLRGKQLNEKQHEKKATGKQTAMLTGQAPLPERIRIHSRQLLRILEKIHGSEISTRQPLVILRPFKVLVYYDQQLRERYERLSAKFPSLHSPDCINDRPSSSTTTEDTITQSRKDYGTPSELKQHESEKKKQEEKTVQTTGDDDRDQPEADETDDDSTSSTALEHLGCLLKFMNSDISNKLAYLSGTECQKIFFSDVWHLFKPGDEVIGSDGRQAYRVISVTSAKHKVFPPGNYWMRPRKSSKSDEETPITIDCVYVDFDGKKFGPVRKTFQIKRFDGEKAVTFLEVYPLRFHATKRGEMTRNNDQGLKLREELIYRGQKFLEVAAVKHMYYSGPALQTRDEIESQVVIDFETAFSAEENREKEWKPNIVEMFATEPKETDEDESCQAECCRYEEVHDDAYVEKKRNEEYLASLVPESREKLPSVAVYPRSLHATNTPDNQLTEEDFVIMSYRVFGFILRSRKWEQLDLTHLSEINSRSDVKGQTGQPPTAFDNLVLPEGHKNMVESLILQHFRDKESLRGQSYRSDIVRGKGKGLILLLHGAPGVGKTTTAEGVAEKFQKPLFQITCGDLGSTAAEVEKALETNFSLANRWGCILLLDEADVFLSARSPTDFTRNGLVAVFLRVLEYYAGILFLTTNRIGDFDEAFASRIHISLYYPPLDLSSTKEVFKLNLKMIRERLGQKGRKLDLDDKSILNFADEWWNQQVDARWNGRQIRNACQTALALAEFEAKSDESAEIRLSKDHLRTVAYSYLEFMSYLKDLYGTGADQRAKESGLRASVTPKQLKDFSTRMDPSKTYSQTPRMPRGDPYRVQNYPTYPAQPPEHTYGPPLGTWDYQSDHPPQYPPVVVPLRQASQARPMDARPLTPDRRDLRQNAPQYPPPNHPDPYQNPYVSNYNGQPQMSGD
ncbi:uncharacterized protein K452DRAFT_237314 [Aplosporella prunicola CBS 121167]|uniref:AAA+ ATPase domain-containing protein n=1 Tax=Aplosporella prunicola CBS 121167 TaxID=1176127 RepID=A0A6A6AY62_9PEZI|nr:uncharacterized protein K452DRAFT_237314 [Aplosporella prunicola CBS 121167]KAF2136546.1 hypothetical protein K452DRAFT_237314 [Aplosporella prunicola CBS 121167]